MKKRPYAVWCLSDKTYHWWRWASYSTRGRAEAAAEHIRTNQFNGGIHKWIREVEVRA